MKKNLAAQPSFLREWKGFDLYDSGPYDSTEKNVLTIHVPPVKDPMVFVHSLLFDTVDPAALNKAIEEAKEWINNLRRCKKCGCTEHDCRQCIEKTGGPCHWVDKDLCSACQEEPEVIVKDSRASASVNLESEDINEQTIITEPGKDMSFFTQLALMGDVDMTIRIMKKNGKFTLNIMPGSRASRLQPLLVTGTPEELDEEFFSAIAPEVKEITGIVTNLADVKKEAKENAEKKSSKPAATKAARKKSTSRKPPAKKAAVKKAVEKKPAVKKSPEKKPPAKKAAVKKDKVKTVKPKAVVPEVKQEETPRVVETSMF